MQKTVKRTILACIAGLLMTIGLSCGQSKTVQAYGNDNIYGLVFWGTSGVSRMYGDLGIENYENTSESSSGHIGTEEQEQHLWTSTVSSSYGYLNYANFSNYWVSDAKNYATQSRVSKGQVNLSGVLSNLNSDKSQKLKFGYIKGSDDSWDECKTAVVIWAGEDWVVRDSNGTDAGLSSASALQIDWMGQICAEEDDGGKHQFLDSDNPREYTTGEPGTDTQDLDLNVQEQDVDYDTLLANYQKKYPDVDVETDPPSMDDLKAAYDYDEVSGYSGSGHSKNSTSTILTGTKTTGYRHKLVFDNSYLVSDEHLAQYSYSAAEDGLDVTLEHILDEPTDAFPADTELPNQAALCFGRLLSGYTYTVEFLQQDTSKIPSEEAEEATTPNTIWIWVPEYFPEWTEEDVKLDTIYYYNTTLDEEPIGNSTKPTEQELKDVRPENDSNITRELTSSSVKYVLVDRQEHEDADYISYAYEAYATFIHPAYYIWHYVEVEVPVRCDTDRSANYGYADSNDTHEYGGFDGLITGAVISGNAGRDYQEGTEETIGLENTSYTVDNEAENYDEDGNPCSSYGSTTVPHTEWYTDLDKPIMKVVTEEREVEGWIPYWQYNTTSALKVYVFGLGPYNKAEYEDQMDEHWDDNKTNETEVEQTKRIDNARKTWNSTLQTNLSGGQFMELWDSILEKRPYYRFQDVSVNTYTSQSDAQHGKWYDRHTYQDIFHMIWSTVLADNPNDEGDPAIDMSLYSLSSSLTSYANNVLFGGRTDDNDSNEDTHSLPELLNAGVSGAGAALGCGDEDYDFSPYLTTSLSMSASTASYKGLLQNSDTNAMYEYARYGHLLEDLGIDEVGEESVISTRSILGTLMSATYIADAGLVMIWDLALSVLKTLNPFQILKYASSISSNMKAGMYDSSDSFIIQWASNNTMVQSALEQVGQWYDALANLGWIVLMVLFVILIASLLFRPNMKSGDRWGKIGRYAIRFVFIVVGVPLLGMAYTEVLNQIADETTVASVPATEMVKATFVDFGGWVSSSRLNPLNDTTLVSDGDDSDISGYASDDSIEALRKSAVAINDLTEIMPDVDASDFTGDVTDTSSWNNNAWKSYNASSSDAVLSSNFNGQTSYSEDWGKDWRSLNNAFSFIQSWANGDFYYASNFGSYTMTKFSGEHDSLVGRQKGIDEDTSETGWNNDNTLFQLYDECVGLDNWMDRSQEENEKIMNDFSAYSSGSDFGNGETHSDGSKFNVFANGTLTTNVKTATADSSITYEGGSGITTADKNGNVITSGTDITQQTGLSTLSMYNYLMTDFGEDMLTVYSPVSSASGNIQKNHYTTTLVGSGWLQWLFFASCFVFMLVAAVIGIGYACGMMWSILKHSAKLIGSIPFAMLGVIRSIFQAVILLVGMIVEILLTILMYDIVCQLLVSILTLLETPVFESVFGTINNSISSTSMVSGGILGSIYQILPECMNGSLAGFIIYLGGSTLLVGLIAVGLIVAWPRLMPVIDKATEWSLLHICVDKDIQKEILQNADAVQQKYSDKENCQNDLLCPAPLSTDI